MKNIKKYYEKIRKRIIIIIFNIFIGVSNMPSFKTRKIRRKRIRRKHDHEGLDSTHIPTKQDNDAFQSNVLDMQGIIGNKATMQMMRQGDVEQSKTKSKINPQSFTIAPSASGIAIQRLMANENYYYSAIEKREAITPPIRSFMGKLRVYQLHSNGKVDPDGIRDFNGKFRDFLNAARAFNEYAQDQYAIDVGKTNLDGAVKLRCNTRVKQLGNEALDDAMSEMKGVWALRSDPALTKDMMTWADAINIKRSGMSLGSMKTGADLVGDGDRKELTGGNASEQVTAMTYEDGTDEGERRVFKPNESRLKTVPDGVDVEKEQFNSAARTVAVAKVEAVIRQKYEAAEREFESMVGKIDFAMDTGEGGTGKFGTVQDMAEGQEGYGLDMKAQKDYTANIDIDDVKVQQQLANLQLFDILVGQMDRHMGNVFIKQQEGSDSKVSGIDNDFAFSAQTDLSKNIGKTTLPEKIDYYFADALTRMDAEELVTAMSGLPQKLIAAAVNRLEQIKALIADKLEEKSLIVAPGDDALKNDGFTSWDEIDVDSYRDSKFGAGKKDYAGFFATSRKRAINEIAADIVKNRGTTDIAPVKNGEKWELLVNDMNVLVGREEDGSDLEEIVHTARLNALAQMSRGRRSRRNRVAV